MLESKMKMIKKKIHWKQIWERKGNDPTTNLKTLNGYENTSIIPPNIATNIIQTLKIKPSDTLLEVGAGAGMLAQYLSKHCHYTGTDYSESLCKKHKDLLGNQIIHCEASQLPFRNNQFDKTFCFSVFQYFPDHEYAKKTIQELLRVTKSTILIGDLPLSSHDQDHLLFNKKDWSEWTVSNGYYTDKRFNVYKSL